MFGLWDDGTGAQAANGTDSADGTDSPSIGPREAARAASAAGLSGAASPGYAGPNPPPHPHTPS